MAAWGRWQKPDIMNRYPHLLQLDAAIWTKYLEREGANMKRVQYDVYCGHPMVWPEGVEPVKGQAEALGSKRVDAIYEHTLGGFHLAEIKPWGNYVAYGQILMYQALIKAERPEIGPLAMHIVCSQADPDIVKVCQRSGIMIDEM